MVNLLPVVLLLPTKIGKNMISYIKIRFYNKTDRTLVNTRKIEDIPTYAKKN